MAKTNIQRLTDPKLLASNTFYSIVGNLLPIIIALFAIPITIRGLGIEKFGLLSIIWILIGYFGLFDMGLGKAMTQIISEKLGKNAANEIPEIFWTTIISMTVLGLAGGIAVIILSNLLIVSLLKVSSFLRQDALNSMYVVGISIPVVILTTGFIGYFSAEQKFKLINGLKILLGALTFLSPIVVLLYSNTLFSVIFALFLVRVLVFLLHVLFCFLDNPSMFLKIQFKISCFLQLIRFGGWLTVSNIIGPIMTYVDRFFVGILVSLSAVAYYTTPYDVVMRLLSIPVAFSTVVFPAFALSHKEDIVRTRKIFEKSIKYIYLFIFPIALFFISFAPQGLSLWLGESFAKNSTAVFQILMIGIFINSVSQIPYVFIQGVGRSDLTGIFHLIEFPLYVFFLFFFAKNFGIEGFAIAWVLRIIIDFSLLIFVANKMICFDAKTKVQFFLFLVISTALLVIDMFLFGIFIRVAYFFVIIFFLLIVSRFFLLQKDEFGFVFARNAKGLEENL